MALVLPSALAAAFALALRVAPPVEGARDPLTGLARRAGLVAALDRALADGRRRPRHLRHGDRDRPLPPPRGAARPRRGRAGAGRHRPPPGRRCCARPTCAARLDGPTFAVAFAAVRRLDLDAAVLLAGRLQRTLSDPIAAGGFNVHPTVSIGFALPARLHRADGRHPAAGRDARADRGAAERAGRRAQLLRVDARPRRHPQQPCRRGRGRARPGRDPGLVPAAGLDR